MMDFAVLLMLLMSARKELLLLSLLHFLYWLMPPETGLILSVLMCGDVNKYVHLVTRNIVVKKSCKNQMLQILNYYKYILSTSMNIGLLEVCKSDG